MALLFSITHNASANVAPSSIEGRWENCEACKASGVIRVNVPDPIIVNMRALENNLDDGTYGNPVPMDRVSVSSFFQKDRSVKIGPYYKTEDHDGIDFSSKWTRGVPVFAVADGVIEDEDHGCSNSADMKTKQVRPGANVECGGRFGNNYMIRQTDGRIGVYGHLDPHCKGIKQLRKGDKVKKGDQIGCIGSSGMASGFHLCFQIWEGGSKKGEHTEIAVDSMIMPYLRNVEVQDNVFIPQHLVGIVRDNNTVKTINGERVSVVKTNRRRTRSRA